MALPPFSTVLILLHPSRHYAIQVLLIRLIPKLCILSNSAHHSVKKQLLRERYRDSSYAITYAAIGLSLLLEN